MVVGVLRVSLRLEGCRSLKDKRQIIRPLIEKMRRDFGASVAEVGDTELWGNSEIGISVVSGNAVQVEQLLQKIIERAEAAAHVQNVEQELIRL